MGGLSWRECAFSFGTCSTRDCPFTLLILKFCTEERILASNECSRFVEKREGGGGRIKVDGWHVSYDWE